MTDEERDLIFGMLSQLSAMIYVSAGTTAPDEVRRVRADCEKLGVLCDSLRGDKFGVVLPEPANSR